MLLWCVVGLWSDVGRGGRNWRQLVAVGNELIRLLQERLMMRIMVAAEVEEIYCIHRQPGVSVEIRHRAAYFVRRAEISPGLLFVLIDGSKLSRRQRWVCKIVKMQELAMSKAESGLKRW